METLELPAQATEPAKIFVRSNTRWMLLAFLLVAGIPFYWSIHSVIVRLAQNFPQSPWESEIVVDAWRANHGMRVYTMPAEDHATTMYGPLITYLVAAIYRFVKVSISVPRWIAFLSAAAVTIGISAGVARRRGLLIFFIGIPLLFLQFYRARANFAESRPDAISVLFSVIAVWMFYLAHTRKFWWMIAGIAAMLIGFGFKQPASAVAIVPLFAVLFTRPPQISKHLLVAITPLLAMAATIAAIRHFAPTLYYYMVTVPTIYHIYLEKWPLKIIELVSMNSLFIVAALIWITDRRATESKRRASLWLLAIVLVTALSGSAATSKWGGKENNYLPVFLAAATFSLFMLPRTIEKLGELFTTRRAQICASLLLGILLIADATSVANYDIWAQKDGEVTGDANYKKIIRRVRKLHGQVICPDDPTIPLLAKGFAGRGIICELDASGWIGRPKYVREEWQAADYLITVHGIWTPRVTASDLLALGYRRVDDRAFAKSAYVLWRHKPSKKTHPATSPS